MPQETLNFPPAYCAVGAYRLLHDPVLWKPMWARCSQAAKKAGIASAIWAVVTWPMQKLFVHYFMSGSARVTGLSAMYHAVVGRADALDSQRDHRFLGFVLPSLTTFAAMIFVLGQVNMIMEFWLSRQLKACRAKAYEDTVRSRGKPEDWWTPYAEEWEEPPLAKAKKNTQKQKLYMRLATPLFRIVLFKVFLLPLDFIPFLGLAVSSVIRSLSMGRQLHAPLFAAKKMTPLEVELWVTERELQYRSFGLIAALLESLPLIGLAFSVSNRIGAAMYAHDLEKRQQLFHAGKLAPLSRDRTYKRGHSPSSSQSGKLPFAPQADDDQFVPGGVSSSAAGSSSKTTATRRPVPRPPANDEGAPPAYSEADAARLVGESGGPGGNLGLAPAHAPPQETRKVPPAPPPRK